VGGSGRTLDVAVSMEIVFGFGDGNKDGVKVIDFVE
jgi:hypothetical protein